MQRIQQEQGTGWVQRAIAVFLFPASGAFVPAIGAEWYLRGTGIAASNHFEAGGFIRSTPDETTPDLQFHFAIAKLVPGTNGSPSKWVNYIITTVPTTTTAALAGVYQRW